MELSWSTLALEMFNFLVLLWLLKRFFYKPVQSVIKRRQDSIEERLARAEQMEVKANKMLSQYEERKEQWHLECEQAREALQTEIKLKREKEERSLRDSLEQERQRNLTLEIQHSHDLERQLELRALEQGSQFAAQLLKLASGPELENRLIELFIHALNSLDEDRIVELRNQLSHSDALMQISSAFTLTEEKRITIKKLMKKILQRDLQYHFVEDSELVAGLRIRVGPWELGANINDELLGFSSLMGDLMIESTGR
ncbi:F0F1 ATP synthase subunit delta [Microbulbifer variabilis]|uniref:F0F1 ATP synthase subunit delta n=1 Tax=Microbulbifer variabilis TaxID=266805 RepID=UPI001CFDB87D|nr:F0F1 ATP synthase subunit delta [Microbulbifer variabilis]